MKLKNSNGAKTQKNSNGDKIKKKNQIVTKLINSNCDQIQIVTMLKLGQKLNLDKNFKIKKVTKFKLQQNSKT